MRLLLLLLLRFEFPHIFRDDMVDWMEWLNWCGLDGTSGAQTTVRPTAEHKNRANQIETFNLSMAVAVRAKKTCCRLRNWLNSFNWPFIAIFSYCCARCLFHSLFDSLAGLLPRAAMEVAGSREKKLSHMIEERRLFRRNSAEVFPNGCRKRKICLEQAYRVISLGCSR